MQRFFDHIFVYYDSPQPIGSDEIIKRLQMWLNNPQCGHKEGQKFQFLYEITIKACPPNYKEDLVLSKCCDSFTPGIAISPGQK